MDKLVEINLDVLKVLRERYKDNWPINELAYNTLNNYIKWFQQDPNLQGFSAYCLNGDWSDGTFVLMHYSMIFGDTLSENAGRLTKALCLLNLDPKSHYRFYYMKSIRPCVWNFVKQKELKTCNEWSFLLYFMEPEEALKIDLPDLPKGLTERSLSQADVAEINRNWPFSYPSADIRLNHLVRHNISVGLYKDDGKLAGWVIKYELGATGILHVHEPFRRQGLAKYLVKAIARKVGELGEYSYSTILKENELSNRLFQSIGYKTNVSCYYLEITPSVKL